jgi:hypothetical protein
MDVIRRPTRPLGAVALVLAVLAGAATSDAEPTEPGLGARSVPAAPGPRPEGEAAITRERLELAARTVAAVEAAGWSIQAELRRARQASDQARVRGQAACLDDVLSQVHVAARSGRAMKDAVADATARGDGEGAARELVRLQHLRDRSLRLVRDAAHCGEGEAVIEGGRAPRGTGATIVRVIAPRLPDAAGYPGHPRSGGP